MDPGDIPLLAMLKSRLGYLSDRQRVIAENVANSDTPGYRARDLKAFTFEAQLKAQSGVTSSVAATPAGVMAVTQPGHMQPEGGDLPFQPTKSPDSEVALDSNGVVLEDEMVKLTQARMDYDAAIGFYQQSLSLLKMAVRKPGG